MIKLNLKQNAFHSLYHAIEHLGQIADDPDEVDGRSFHHDSHSVVHRSGSGSTIYYSGNAFTKPASIYNYKFAILHLIQSLELLIKAYLHSVDPDLIYEDANKERTISLRKG